MTTRSREGPPGKEKRGISPTLTRHNNAAQRRSPNPSAGSTDHKHDSSSSEKHVPNYLKPTKSSTGLDQSAHHVRKPASASDPAHKTGLARKRSFDKPAPSHASKAGISSNLRERNLRPSSSLPSKTTSSTLQKTLPDRFSKAPKDGGRKQGLASRPVGVKKSSSGTKKQDFESSSAMRKAPMTGSSSIVDNPVIVDIPQSQDEDPQLLVTDEEFQIIDEMPAEIVHVEDKEYIEEYIDPQQVEPETKIHEEIQITESLEAAASPDVGSVAMEEPEDQNSVAEEAIINHVESEQHVDNEDTVNSANESLVHIPKAEDPEKVTGEDAAAEEALEKKEEATTESQLDNFNNAQALETAVKEQKQEAENVPPKRLLPVLARNQSSVSNDVIEETASKLREQRKNKVRALAGAFETVISLQEPK